MFIMSSHSLYIHDIHLVHMHAIGVPKRVTLVKEPAQEVQPAEPEASVEVVLECPSHEPSSFVKGKPWSILSLLI
jgi:hypothetical protein